MHFYVPVTYKSTALRFGLEVKKNYSIMNLWLTSLVYICNTVLYLFKIVILFFMQ